ncbi:MAG: PaaI family thioesterase [Alphaproteobacteria bacterium]|nr:PaaI family thioesterase [Alphaproteobacteria bacterium]
MNDLRLGYEAIIPHIRALSMRALEIGDGVAVMLLPYQETLVGDVESGVLHGGAVTTLIDSAAGLAVLAAMAEPGPIATLDLRIDYLRPATPGKDVLARAECFRMTRQVAFVRASAYHADEGEDDPVAACQASFVVKSVGGGLEADRRPR